MASWKWWHLKYLKWFGFGHSTRELAEGELALFCASCPQLGINLPNDWKDDPVQYVALLLNLLSLLTAGVGQYIHVVWYLMKTLNSHIWNNSSQKMMCDSPMALVWSLNGIGTSITLHIWLKIDWYGNYNSINQLLMVHRKLHVASLLHIASMIWGLPAVILLAWMVWHVPDMVHFVQEVW